MKVLSTAKERIFKKIRQALNTPVPVPFPQSDGTETMFVKSEDEPEVVFAENFSKLQGRFSYCFDEKEMVQQLALLVESRKWKKLFCRETGLQKMLVSNGLVN